MFHLHGTKNFSSHFPIEVIRGTVDSYLICPFPLSYSHCEYCRISLKHGTLGPLELLKGMTNLLLLFSNCNLGEPVTVLACSNRSRGLSYRTECLLSIPHLAPGKFKFVPRPISLTEWHRWV